MSAGYAFARANLQHAQPMWVAGVYEINAIPEGWTWYNCVVSRLLALVPSAAPEWDAVAHAEGRDADILFTCFGRGIHKLVSEHADPVTGALLPE
jgi:hypothetical protein